MIDQKLEELFRELTGHAIRNRQDDIARVITEAGPETYEQVAGLAVQAAAYICIDTAERWPADTDLKETARIASESGTGLGVTKPETYSYLARVVFGSEPLSAVCPSEQKAALIPLFTLANLLVSFKPPQGKGWNDWLDVIESAIEAAGQARATDLPAMTYRYLKK